LITVDDILSEVNRFLDADGDALRQAVEQEHLLPGCVGVNALSLNNVQSNTDRMIVKEVIVDLEALTGKQFTIDACCDDSGVNAHCAEFCSPARSFLSSDVSGKHVWLNAPFARVGRFLKHYLRCKSEHICLHFGAC